MASVHIMDLKSISSHNYEPLSTIYDYVMKLIVNLFDQFDFFHKLARVLYNMRS